MISTMRSLAKKSPPEGSHFVTTRSPRVTLIFAKLELHVNHMAMSASNESRTPGNQYRKVLQAQYADDLWPDVLVLPQGFPGSE